MLQCFPSRPEQYLPVTRLHSCTPVCMHEVLMTGVERIDALMSSSYTHVCACQGLHISLHALLYTSWVASCDAVFSAPVAHASSISSRWWPPGWSYLLSHCTVVCLWFTGNCESPKFWLILFASVLLTVGFACSAELDTHVFCSSFLIHPPPPSCFHSSQLLPATSSFEAWGPSCFPLLVWHALCCVLSSSDLSGQAHADRFKRLPYPYGSIRHKVTWSHTWLHGIFCCRSISSTVEVVCTFQPSYQAYVPLFWP